MDEQLIQLRDEYIINIVGQFIASSINQTINNCYKYVCEIKELTINDFIAILNDENREILEENPNGWFAPLFSIETFEIFLNNNDITI
ncbi:MAG: hypothetical protein ACOYMA_20220 [Bacteroidia bacterium]